MAPYTLDNVLGRSRPKLSRSGKGETRGVVAASVAEARNWFALGMCAVYAERMCIIVVAVLELFQAGMDAQANINNQSTSFILSLIHI